ncbi:MAG: hypothetical protein GY906_12195 [bacterium]|nr:hypothetical protein [bacterium]
MADFSSGSAQSPNDWQTAVPNQSVNLFDREPAPQDVVGAVIPATSVFDAQHVVMNDEIPTVNDLSVQEHAYTDMFFFERIHYTPPVIELGNLLSTVTEEVEVYNAYRDESQTLTSVTNNAGAGISFVGLPGLPTEIESQNGEVFDIVISTVGPPQIDGTIDFVTDPGNFSIPITGSRVVMFAFQPEKGVTEKLVFLTDTIRASDGTEQRIANRLNPRQTIEWTLKLEEGEERRRALTLMKGWHPRVFGIPIWWEARPLAADAISGASTISVDSRYGDFRVGSLAIVWSDSDYFDALEIDTVTETSIQFSSPVTHDYDQDTTLVMPLRVAYSEDTFDIQRFLTSLQEIKCRFRVIDNEVGDIGDTSAFSMHNSKVMLDDYNLAGADGVVDNQHQQLAHLDNATGNAIQWSTWDTAIPITQKSFNGNSLQSVWEVRQLVHALRGSQISFYLPTFYYDLVVVNDLGATSDLMDIESIGYVDYIQAKEPWTSIRVELTDGTVLTRQVIDYETISSTVERLTVDSTWGSLITVPEIEKVSFLRKVRIADDTVEFIHDYPGSSKISMNIRGAP